MFNKRASRIRRAQKTRARIKRKSLETKIARLCVHRTPRHIYGQIIAAGNGNILASASSLDKEIRAQSKNKVSKTEMAVMVGKLLADRAKKAGVMQIASDRSGFSFHGRIKAFVETIRENGVQV